jgi:GGDEF domain-containing protein
MRTAEMMIWSAEVGSVGLIVLLALADAIYSRSRGALNALVYLSCAWLFIALLSGLPQAVFPGFAPSTLHVLQVLIGPLCTALGSYGASLWMSAHKRDRATEICLLGSTVLALVGGPLCLLAPPALQLPISACLSIGGLALTCLFCLRAGQLGDRMAWGLAAGMMLTIPLEIGLYWMVFGESRPTLSWQAAAALAGLTSITVTATMIWLRNRRERQIRHHGQSRRDPITQLYSSVVIVQKIIRAQQRSTRSRHDGALMAVVVFEPEFLASQVGHYGLNEIYIQLARRVQRHTGVVNPAGRYYDRCFIVLMETMHSPRWIRTLGLRVATSLRRPVDVTSLSGERIRVTADIGVGIVHLSGSSGRDADELLDNAQRAAEAARGMRSRAALLDPQTQHAVPVESAELGDSWKAQHARTTRPQPLKGTARSPARGKAGRNRGKNA